MEPPYSRGSLELRRAPPYLADLGQRLTAPTGSRPCCCPQTAAPGERSLRVPSASGRGLLRAPGGGPETCPCAAQSALAVAVGCAWLEGGWGLQEAPGLRPRRLVMCSLYVGGPRLLGLSDNRERKVGSRATPMPISPQVSRNRPQLESFSFESEDRKKAELTAQRSQALVSGQAFC